MTLREVFINNLKYYRKQKGFRQLDLALEIEKSSNYINSIENGKYFPSPETIEKIAFILEISPAELFINKSKENNSSILEKNNFDKIEEQLKEKILKEVGNSFIQLKKL